MYKENHKYKEIYFYLVVTQHGIFRKLKLQYKIYTIRVFYLFILNHMKTT